MKIKKLTVIASLLAFMIFFITGCEITIPAKDPTKKTSKTESNSSLFLGQPKTLEEAQKISGLYMKEGDKFVLIKPQWTINSSGFNGYTLSSETAKNVFSWSGDVSVLMPILYDEDYEIPQISNNAQFVLIGITDIAIYEVVCEGWTIPIGISLGTPGGPNPGGWIQTYTESAILYNSSDKQNFEELNGREPTDYIDHMLYTGYKYLMASYHGLLTGNQGEEFTFAWWNNTDWIEKTYTADKKYYALPTLDTGNAIRADYEIVKTSNGYFEVNFLSPPYGHYAIGSSLSHFDRIVDFVS